MGVSTAIRFDAIAGQVLGAGYGEPIEIERRFTFCPSRRSRTTKCRSTNNTASNSTKSLPRRVLAGDTRRRIASPLEHVGLRDGMKENEMTTSLDQGINALKPGGEIRISGDEANRVRRAQRRRTVATIRASQLQRVHDVQDHPVLTAAQQTLRHPNAGQLPSPIRA